MNTPVGRLKTINRLLEAALDSEGGYLYEGEMCAYMRSYATDAATELEQRFGVSPPTSEEIEACVRALSDPERIARGRSKGLLLRLGDKSRPLLDALSRSDEPRLRILALDTGATSAPWQGCYSPLYGSDDMERRLLRDSEAEVRVKAISVSEQTLRHNAAHLGHSLRTNCGDGIAGLFRQLLDLLEDPSPEVRAAAAKTLGSWASYAGREKLVIYLDREEDPEARQALAAAITACDSPDETWFSYPEDYPDEFKPRG